MASGPAARKGRASRWVSASPPCASRTSRWAALADGALTRAGRNHPAGRGEADFAVTYERLERGPDEVRDLLARGCIGFLQHLAQGPEASEEAFEIRRRETAFEVRGPELDSRPMACFEDAPDPLAVGERELSGR